MSYEYSTPAFEAAYTYTGSDLGAVWQPDRTNFRLWAPTAAAAQVDLYRSGDEAAADLLRTLPMTADAAGTWVALAEGDQNGVYYTYTVTFADGSTATACDPYAVTTGVNGRRAMVLDRAATDPAGWDADTPPHTGGPTDAVIYELHLRDISVDPAGGIVHKGKYLGLTETGTKSPAGCPTGLDHIKDLGVTHVHLLPVFDYGSVDEARTELPQFNWGYDPVNYNAPEGSYATDAADGAVRVREFKQMVQTLHQNGLGVILDVVYNHVYDADSFCFNKLAPLYFTRVTNGVYSNGSACGNDTASERAMVRKYIVDSICHWADEYHVDGFRFDLVGLLDTETIDQLVAAVHAKHPHVLFYGEGWTMPTDLTRPDVAMATQTNSALTPGFAYFSDTVRDGLRGSVFINDEMGYVSGDRDPERAAAVACSVTATPPWCSEPAQIVNYASCHDNMTLYDRIAYATPQDSPADRIRMNNLAAAIILTSQGIPFMQAGEELLRTKPLPDGGFDHNSYQSPDAVNCIKWDTLADPAHGAVLAYYKGLIALRKAHPALRMQTADQVAGHMRALADLPGNMLGFAIAPGARGEQNAILLLYNPDQTAHTLPLPAGSWHVCANGEKAGTDTLETVSCNVTVERISAAVLVQ